MQSINPSKSYQTYFGLILLTLPIVLFFLFSVGKNMKNCCSPNQTKQKLIKIVNCRHCIGTSRQSLMANSIQKSFFAKRELFYYYDCFYQNNCQ